MSVSSHVFERLAVAMEQEHHAHVLDGLRRHLASHADPRWQALASKVSLENGHVTFGDAQDEAEALEYGTDEDPPIAAVRTHLHLQRDEHAEHLGRLITKVLAL